MLLVMINICKLSRTRGDIIELSCGSSLFKFSRSGMNIVLTKIASNMNTFQIRVAKHWNKIPDDVKLSADVDPLCLSA